MTDTTPAVRIVPEDVIAACKGEQEHFEAWAKAQHYDMGEHPLHYIFMDPRTDAARMGWNAALAYVRALAAAPVAPAGEDEWSELEKLADAATPGEWRIPSEDNNPFTDGRHVFASGLDGTNFVVANLKTDQTFVTATSREQQQHNAAFIAAANPATIKRLIAALRARSEPEDHEDVLREGLKERGLDVPPLPQPEGRSDDPDAGRFWQVVAAQRLKADADYFENPEEGAETHRRALRWVAADIRTVVAALAHPAPSDSSAAERMRDALRQIADGLPGVRAPHRFASARDIARAAIGEA